MMTSRAEYRMLLRQDNADLRLRAIGYRLGLVDETRYRATEEKRQAIEAEIERLKRVSLKPSPALDALLSAQGLEPIQAAVSAYQLLKRPGADYRIVQQVAPSPVELSPEAIEQIDKQQRQVERLRRLEDRALPSDLDYGMIVGLRSEARERLMRHRPGTLGQASRIQGVNPADISVLLVHLHKLSA
jgi:tRNA uridine 5-carboxymethylaminomethyl modification enzyme